MYNIEKIKLHSTKFPFNAWDDTLEIIFEIDEQDIWSKNFTIRINKDGEIVGCSSCISTMDNIDYYIQIGETLSLIKNFITKYGKEIYDKFKEIEKTNDKTFAELQNIIECKENEIKENRGYHALTDEMNELFNEIYALRKTRRRLRREDKIAEITKEIEEKELRYNHVGNIVNDIQNEIDKYSNDYDKVFKELRESNSNLIDNILDNYMLKLGELIEG